MFICVREAVTHSFPFLFSALVHTHLSMHTFLLPKESGSIIASVISACISISLLRSFSPLAGPCFSVLFGAFSGIQPAVPGAFAGQTQLNISLNNDNNDNNRQGIERAACLSKQ